MAFVRLYNGSDGHAHFEEMDILFAPRDPDELQGTVGRLNVANQQQPVFVVKEKIQGAFFEHQLKTVAEVTDTEGWHPTRQRHWVCFLSGTHLIKTQAGESRIFYPGDVLLNEDMEPTTGHTGYTIEEPWIWCAIMLADE